MDHQRARIHVERVGGMITDRARAYHVLVDGQDRESVRHDETVAIDVRPGTHTVRMRIDWGRSPELTVELAAGDEVLLRCRPNANPLTGLYYATFGRKRYVALWRP